MDMRASSLHPLPVRVIGSHRLPDKDIHFNLAGLQPGGQKHNLCFESAQCPEIRPQQVNALDVLITLTRRWPADVQIYLSVLVRLDRIKMASTPRFSSQD